MILKYVKIKNNGSEYIVVFPEILVHSAFKHLNPISAGFIIISTYLHNDENRCECYGESISLKLTSDPLKDSELANQQLSRHC